MVFFVQKTQFVKMNRAVMPAVSRGSSTKIHSNSLKSEISENKGGGRPGAQTDFGHPVPKMLRFFSAKITFFNNFIT